MGVIPSSIFRFGVDAAFLGGLGFEGYSQERCSRMHGHQNVRRIGVSKSVNRCSVNVKGSGERKLLIATARLETLSFICRCNQTTSRRLRSDWAGSRART